MLHRSFKPAKCKTALKLAASRIKLMKNKRDAQVKQLKRELAKLLESGQVQTARIRVEHVVREQKTLAAYELLEVYCELIAARLPMIESQKNCPVDLKEAISSVIFASPRCDDIPELKDICKHLTAKYGKEFASAAVELRPNCGVGRLLVEKLSATAPDGPTKVKILSAIAEEHNITWDPNSFAGGDSKAPEDLLNGPNTFGKASETLVDLPNAPSAPTSQGDKGSSQVLPKSNERHDLPVNFHEQNARPSPRSQTDVGANEAKQSGDFHPELRPTGSSAATMEFRHPYSGQGQPFLPGSQNWNMEFTDAAAAAHAAAESAERASMAARAAAELSSRGNIHSTESQRDEASQRYGGSTLRNEHHGPVNNAFHGKNSRMHFEHINENLHRESLKSPEKSRQSSSLMSNADSVGGNPSENNRQMADGHSRKNSSELEHRDHLGQVSIKKQSSKSEVEFVDKLQGGVDSQSVDAYEGVRVRKQSSRASSHSQSSTFSDDHDAVSDIDCQSLGDDANENTFAASDNESRVRKQSSPASRPQSGTLSDDHDVLSNIHCQGLGDDANENPFAASDSSFIQSNFNSHENAGAVFDDSGSDDDVFKIGIEDGHKEHDYSSDFSSQSRKSPAHVFANENAWSDKHHSDPIFSEGLTSSRVPSQSDDMFPATFDDYDGPSSESREELDKTQFGRSTDTIPHNIYSGTSEITEDVTSRLAAAKEEEDTELLKQSSLDSGTGLNFGLLTGGIRNKGNWRPRYITGPIANASSSKSAAEDTSAKVDEFPAASVKASISPGVDKKPPSSISYFASRDDYLDDELTQQTSKGSREPYYRETGLEENKKLRLRPQVRDFDLDDSDSEDDPPKQGSSMNKAHLNSTPFSRRSKVPVPLSNSAKSSYSKKSTVLPESSVSPGGYGKERNSSTRTLYNTETRPERQSPNKSSGALGSSGQSRLAEQAAYKPNSPSKRPSSEESIKSAAKEPASNSVPTKEKPDTIQSSKTSSMESSSTERAAHVHPKLPDYDTLAARLQSIRQNRQ